MLGTEGLGLLVQQDAESAFRQAGGGGQSDLLHGGEVEGAGLGKGPSCDDFSPFGGEFADLLQFLLRQFALRHDLSSLGLARSSEDGLLFPLYGLVVCPAKGVLASFNAKWQDLPCLGRLGKLG
jgi:hypothetical protein